MQYHKYWHIFRGGETNDERISDVQFGIVNSDFDVWCFLCVSFHRDMFGETFRANTENSR